MSLTLHRTPTLSTILNRRSGTHGTHSLDLREGGAISSWPFTLSKTLTFAHDVVGVFWSSPGRRRHGHRKRSRFVHGRGPRPCTNLIGFARRRRSRPQQLQNAPTGSPRDTPSTATVKAEVICSLHRAICSSDGPGPSLTIMTATHTAIGISMSARSGHGNVSSTYAFDHVRKLAAGP